MSDVVDDKLIFPVLFQSVSSFETQLPTHEAIEALDIFNYKTSLVSAYDLQAREGYDSQLFIKKINDYNEKGGVVLLDSGCYEKYRFNDKTWNREKFHKSIDVVPSDYIFCFDDYDLRQDSSGLIKEIVESVNTDQKITSTPVFPIVHANTNTAGECIFDSLPELVFEVSKRLGPMLIAIPERELGNGLRQRINTICKIRALLNNLGFYQPIHILGTGDPIAIPFFFAAGADSFDGLEWCRKVVDRDQHKLHHFHHFDLFSYQAELADSAITRSAIIKDEVSFIAKVIFHNLDFYENFMSKLSAPSTRGNLKGFIKDSFPESIWSDFIDFF